MTTEEEERIEAGLDLTGEERREARATVRALTLLGQDPAAQRRIYAQAYAVLRESKRRDTADAEHDAIESETRAKEFPPVLIKPVEAAPVERAPNRPALTVTRRGRMLRIECGGLVAFVDPLDVASVNSTSRPGYTDAFAPLTVISLRGGLCIHVPTYTADEVFDALDDVPGNRRSP